ncbi:sperm associated antigen 8 [Engraulis encrasicolus]|uniref:sperm associated antigen 8 n=1 Tax=Engraulis encrasicolus TaxID=184585 RepID=UPI002FD6B3C1
MDVSEESPQLAVGRCLLDNWVEERATAQLDTSTPRESLYKKGHKGILTVDDTAKVQGTSTIKSSYIPPRGPGVRERGRRGELLERELFQKISEQIQSELNPEPPAPDFSSTTHTDYMAEGFQCSGPTLAQMYESKADQAICFWNENHNCLQGVTAANNKDAPFRKNCSFSKPISEQLDHAML